MSHIPEGDDQKTHQCDSEPNLDNTRFGGDDAPSAATQPNHATGTSAIDDMAKDLRRIVMDYVGRIPQQYLYDTSNDFYCAIDQIGLYRGFDATPIIACFETYCITSAIFRLPGVVGYSNAYEFIEDVNPRCNEQHLGVVWRDLLWKYRISGTMNRVSHHGRTTVYIAVHLPQNIINYQLLQETFSTAALLNQRMQQMIDRADRDGDVRMLEPEHGSCVVLISSGLHHGRTGEVLYMLCVPDDYASSNCEWQFARFVTVRDIQLFAPGIAM